MIIEKNTPSAQLETCYEAPAQSAFWYCYEVQLHRWWVRSVSTPADPLGLFFSYCLSQKITSSSFGGVYSWDQQKCDQRVFSCGSWRKTPPVPGCQKFVTQPMKLTEGMLLFGRDGLLGRKCAVLSVAPRKHSARIDIFLEQFNWKKCKSHGQNSCLN